MSGTIAMTPGRQVAPSEPIVIEELPRQFVSRAGYKLQGALDSFAIPLRDRSVLDAGSSTGGFTECVLERGAKRVVSVDVGTNQLHERVRGNPRVDVRERTDIRRVEREDLPVEIDMVTADLSFISTVSLIGHLVTLAGSGGELLVLVKPQFEARRVEIDRAGGVIDDPAVWRRSLVNTVDAFADAGAGIMGVMRSVLPGVSGNVEFFVHARHRQNGLGVETVRADIEAAIEGAR